MKNKTFTTLKECVDAAVGEKYRGEYDCKLILGEDDQKFEAYTVHIGTRELLFYCKNAILTYFVDSYGDRNTVECQSIELDKEEK